VLKEKEQYVAHHVRIRLSLTRHAASTSPVESMNSNIKSTMGCSSNLNTSNSLLKMARGDNEAQRALQTTSLSSKLEIKDTILKECLHICNQNFVKRKYYCCVQCSDDDWMVWNFYYDATTLGNDISGMAPKFLNVFHVCVKSFLSTPFLRCDCLFFEW
jgi:regulator of replication initiation timing